MFQSKQMIVIIAIFYMFLPVIAASDETKLIPSDSAADDQFGKSVAIEGGTVLCGAPRHQPEEVGAQSGVGYILTLTGGSWGVGPGEYDLRDLALLQACFSNSTPPDMMPCCESVDLDGDDIVGLEDFIKFYDELLGP